MPNISRSKNLGKVFEDGHSQLLNGIARLAVFYEDLRFEIGELRIAHGRFEQAGEVANEYRVIYFLRRGLATLIEFRGGLTTLRMTQEFKKAEASLSAVDAGYIVGADKYLQENWSRLKELRNEFGGHVQMAGVEFATRHFSDVVGKVTWNNSPEIWTTALECDFAANVVVGAISSKLQAGTDIRRELNAAVAVIAQGFGHAQAAMVALVHAFLWGRFEA